MMCNVLNHLVVVFYGSLFRLVSTQATFWNMQKNDMELFLSLDKSK